MCVIAAVGGPFPEVNTVAPNSVHPKPEWTAGGIVLLIGKHSERTHGENFRKHFLKRLDEPDSEIVQLVSSVQSCKSVQRNSSRIFSKKIVSARTCRRHVLPRPRPRAEPSRAVPCRAEPSRAETRRDGRTAAAVRESPPCSLSLNKEVECQALNTIPNSLFPIIQNMECGGRPLESFENFDSLTNHLRKVPVDVLTSGWVQKHLMKLYINSCKKLHETPSMKLLRKLYVSEIEDEINVSDCGLLDISVIPLLNALHTHRGCNARSFSQRVSGPFDGSIPGNGTMEKLRQFFSSSNQTYGDLTLDLHCNRFGSTALFQICECPVLFTRLEVLNISGNRLTDACGSYLSTIIEKCRALYSLNVERCSITSRTVQKVADALDTDSLLSQLFIGHNNPVSGNAISSLVGKLATLKRFSELSLNGLKLNKTAVDDLCHLAKTSCLSRLMLEGTGIGTDGALGLTHLLLSSIEEPLKLDLSFCGVACTYISEFNTNVMFINGILELNLRGNPIMQEGGNALASLLMNPQCCLKVLNLNKCQLGMAGILQIVHALAENESLEELNLAHYADMDKQLVIKSDKPTNMSLESLQPNHAVSNGEIDTNCDMLEVADSEDDETRGETAPSRFNDCCASSIQRNSTLECNLIQELSVAICMAKRLQLLDLSDNGLSIQDSEALYNAWSQVQGLVHLGDTSRIR
ncbi:Protein TONSOKU [Hibiscus syriacus]|uniref:Protein TONSOKU n=1 Tax=Hibiscus syriacus TaxID=106335 RepID=A0A6A2ZXY1_HIBSY|nr:Protein TONSOKU [Hibiscus syriacus]